MEGFGYIRFKPNKFLMKKYVILTFTLFLVSILHAQVSNGLVGHFPLDSLDMSDKSGNGNGTISSKGNGMFSIIADRNSVPNDALDFQGGVIEAGTDTRSINDEVSISCWVKPNIKDDTIRIIVTKYYCSLQTGFLLYLRDGKVALDGRDNSSNGYMASGLSDSVNDGLWHHIVGVARSNGDWEIWLDGKMSSSNSYSSINTLSSDCELSIGGMSVSNTKNKSLEYKGGIDEIRIYNRDLDSLEIDTLYRGVTTGLLEQESELNLSWYPNPTEGEVAINTSSINGAFSVELRSITGKLISRLRSDSINELKVNLPESSGLYFVSIITEKGYTKTFKVVRE
jgi:hypothetical protein